MQAGVWRGTNPTIPFSSAWGLVLNLAGVETRAAADGITTLVRADAPCLQLAIGEVHAAERAVLYQQLHTYPVGNSGEELKGRTHGAKYWIAPARRELLVGFDAMLGIRSDDARLLDAVVQGVRGEGKGDRYGLPFAGDNNLLFDRIDVVEEAEPARWYVPLGPASPARKGSCRLTIAIDRADSSRTTSRVFAPISAAALQPPADAWTWAPRAP